MSLWWRARSGRWILLALGLQALVLALVDPAPVRAPTITGDGSTTLPWPAYLCLVPALASARSLDSRGSASERQSVRPVRLADGVLVGTVAAVAALIGWLLVDDPALSGLAARNAILLTLAAGVAAVLGGSARAAAVLVGVLVATQSYGPGAPASGAVRILQQQADPRVTTALLVVLLVAWPLTLLLASRLLPAGLGPSPPR